ncbi:diguanylate cyclase [Mycobacterium sp. MS1601]|uniref:GGDEF domain-containing protein n=1 Tax=Mycobacterium sp. MS1601 TaxID=1936029 RepID=UPI000979308E|nr:diguanylate cyclase [Mycobacterium sp. MS1601]AQA01551.1 diguanylate cyclase [Mycobacterium sp. MS1601]
MWIEPIERARSNSRRGAVAALVLTLLYLMLGRLTFTVSVEHSNVTSVVFAPEGIALAFAVMFGPRVAWGVLFGQTLLSIWSGPSVIGGLAIGVVNSLECVLGAFLFARWRISPTFGHPRDVLLFVAVVFLVLQPISATGGVSVLWAVGAAPLDRIPDLLEPFWIHGIQQPLTDAGEIPSAWLHWWIGNAVGQVLIAPLILAWAIRGIPRRRTTSPDLIVSAVAITLLGIAATVLPVYPLLMLGVTYPLLVWIGLRRGLRGVTTANVLIAPAITWAGASGAGFLAHLSVPDRLAHVSFFIATATVFSLMLYAMFEERRQLVERLDSLTRVDTLVPLANRRHFVEHLQAELDTATRLDSQLAVVVFDIDHFKRINDDHGHALGDQTLTAVAETCNSVIRRGDIAARMGGEEFAVVLPGCGLDDAGDFGDRLRAAISEQHRTRDDLPAVTVSVGVAAARPHDSLDVLLNRADQALYAAKRAGRNAVEVAGS